jgi:hypothetical protein
MTGLDGESFLDIGVLFDDSMRDRTELVWMETKFDYYWSADLEGVRFTYPNGNTKSQAIKEFSIDKTLGTTDTGTSCNYIPSAYYKSFIQNIVEAEPLAEYIEVYGNYAMPCDSKNAPIVHYLLGGYWLQMDPKDYLLPVDEVELPNEC